MADDVDRAQAREQAQRDDALGSRIQPIGPGRADCIICGDPIPQGRRDAVKGVATCVDCQCAAERRKRGFRPR